jgi:Fe(3+) dicitrate transport protein
MPSCSVPRSRLLPVPVRLSWMLAGVTLWVAPLALAEEIRRMPAIVVVGPSDDEAQQQPGAVSVVSAEELALMQPRSTEEALRSVPGVFIKPEEETAIVANIGVRGLSSADYKTLVLEDGVPVAPGLFVGNGRYYNPRIQRMQSIEVLKGAASLRFGPSTIGGVINYVTKDPADGVAIGLRGGSFGSREATLEVGGSSSSDEAQFGAVITSAKSDGYMDKGFDMMDIMIKAGLDIGSNQRLSVKYTDYDNDANISYRGIFLQEFADEVQYNPAPDDWFLTGHRSLSLNHEWDIGENVRLHTLVFDSEVYRDYWRYATDNAASGAAGRWVYTDNLNGNNRAFDRQGLDSRLQVRHSAFGISNESEIGVRYMTEEMHDVTIAATRATPRTGTLSRDVIDSAESVALHAQNRFLLSERVAVTAGLRVERYEQERRDRRRTEVQGNQADTTNTEVLPGLGATFQINPAAQLYASVYKAFSPALNGDALNGLNDQQLDAEHSLNIEAGLRGGVEGFRYEVTLFRMDFDNQIIPANSNSQFQVTNGGSTLHQGVEAAVGVVLGAGFDLSVNATYIPEAEFDGDRFASNGTLTTPDGNRIPYTPEWVGNVSLGFTRGALRSALSLHHTGSQYTDILNTRPITESTNGFFTGELDSYTLLDLNLVYDVTDRLSLSSSLKNLTDERYMASLRQGIYVGPERSVDVGIRFEF